MDTTQNTTAGANNSPADSNSSSSVGGVAARLGALALVDAFAIWFVYSLVRDGNFFLALTIAVVTIGINIFFSSERMYPYRWFSPGLALMVILVLYPTAFTLYISFTNYADGNLLTKPQALDVLEGRTYTAEDAPSYDWTAYSNEAGDVLLWLEGPEGETLIGRPGQPLLAAAESEFAIEANEPPDALGDFQQVSSFQAITNPQIAGGTFGEGDTAVQIPSSGGDARALQPKYDFQPDENVLVDNETGTVYEPVRGTFVGPEGDQIRPGFYVPIGFDNFQRLFGSDLLAGGPFYQVFVWTFLHAFLAVFFTFWLGLFMAIVLNHELVPAKKILRSALLIPYAIPAFISVLVWRGLLDPNFGVVDNFLEMISFGFLEIPWRSSATAARTAIVMIQLWLGFPYMLLICTGALQGIPEDMYEAAEVDGAGPFRQFWNLTLPLLLVAVGPLLIASFAFNFNNFTVIQLYLDGGPPINTTSVAGFTDILITYTYEVAFSSGRGADYGFATAITIVIFVLLTIVTLLQFQLTRRLEEISENV